ncbi:AGROH133_08824 family phage infection protein [Aurantimonas coralicida]|uniref:AGROH133_08824 family phage infection protein n=1 Tax=Aurantimonas coralicida TaxID=182270 RepID=UPI001D18EE64|nr:DUF4345 family protein [Aurantimonas coralicida]MCC4295922.1 DUF4345 family protein [Aurantimonas coralicida]
MDFALPQTNADMLPFGAACITILMGLVALFAPRITLRLLRLETRQAHPEALAESRATIAGFWLGVGIVTVAFYNQPFVQMALGAGWLFTGFGRFVSILSDRGATLFNWVFLLVALALAGAALAPVFGFIPN